MNDSTFQRIVSRVRSEMLKAGLKLSTEPQLKINKATKIHLEGDPPNADYGWLIVFVQPKHVTIVFGKLNTEKNYACFAVKQQNRDGNFWCALCREILLARKQRELMQNNKTCVSKGLNVWTIYNMEVGND